VWRGKARRRRPWGEGELTQEIDAIGGLAEGEQAREGGLKATCGRVQVL